ncbi:MAG TPA: PKD domain-containing protein, partial [Bacteroidia bacterium]
SDTAIVGCAYSFKTKTYDVDATQNLTLTSNVASAIPAASFTSSGGSRPTGTFNWTPAPSDVSNYPHCFTVNVRDDYCAIEGQQVKSYCITVIDLSANFTSSAPACTGKNVNFYSQYSLNNSYHYLWNFGSGATPATSILPNPAGVVYSTPGSKTVQLEITTPSGCVKSYSMVITINPSPTSSFTTNAPACAGTQINFTNTGSSGAGVTYSWDFGSGAMPATSTAQNPAGVTYTTSGQKVVTLVTSNQFGCVSISTQTITINDTPKASFSSTAPQCTGYNVDFTNTGTLSGVTWAWDFGSGAAPATSTLQSPTGIVYSTGGGKTVVLITTNSTTGCTDTARNSININLSPTASFTSNAPQCANTGINFTNTGSTGGNWAFFWTFGQDANPATSTSENPTGVIYATAGTKTVSLTVTDGNCTQTSTQTITISATPKASFSSTAPQCTLPVSVDFTNTGTLTGVTWAWDFGAGATPATSTMQSPTGIVYSTAGGKTVVLITTNTTTGCTDTARSVININLSPTASFTSNAPQCANTAVNFTNTGSTGGNWAFFWTFGQDANPATSTSENPTGVIYATAGTKTVSLTVTDGNCTQTSTQTITISATPKASFSSTAPQCTLPVSIDFTNTGTLTGVTWAWDFGSGATPATSTLQSPTGIVYSTAGVKIVTLVTTNSITGCTDTARNNININLSPTASFVSNAPQCEGSPVNFTNTGSTGGSWVYNWDFGPGATPRISNAENPSGIIYYTAGTKTITLTIIDGNCSTTFMDTISINQTPVAAFTSNAPACMWDSVNFTYMGNPGPGYIYAWDFGVGATPATSAVQNPTGVIYNSAGTKVVKLNVSLGLCKDSSIQTILINQT